MKGRGSRSGAPAGGRAPGGTTTASALAEQRQAHLARMRAAQDQRVAERAAAEADAAETRAARERFCAAMDEIRLWTGREEQGEVSGLYRALAGALYDVRAQGRSSAVLVWPTGSVSLAACHALCSLALPRSAPVTEQPLRVRAPAPGLRALFFPYSSATRLPLRRVYADRNQVSATCLDHLGDAERRHGPAWAYFSRMCRVKDLTGSVRGGGHHFEYEHPTLDEVVSIVGLGHARDRDVLGRVANRTDLKQLSNLAGDPAASPYALFGLTATARLRPNEGRADALDIMLLDLTRSGRNRLGRDWRTAVASALKLATRLYGRLPVLAVTEDPYVQDVLAFDLLKAHDGLTGKQPTPRDALLGLSPAVVAFAEPEPVNLSTVSRFAALGCADPDPALLKDIAQAAEQARNAGDAPAALLLDEVAGVARRTAALPGGVDALGEFVALHQGVQTAAQRMKGYSVDSLLRSGEDLSGPYSQQHQSRLQNLLRRARTWVDARAAGSPIALALQALIRKGLNGATRKVIWSQTAAVSEFAEHILRSDPEIGARVGERVASNMITFMDALTFREIDSLPRSELAKTKQVFVVSPKRAQAVVLMTQPWLPDEVTLVADERTLAGIGRDAARLAQFSAYAAYADRLSRLGAAASAEAARVRGRALDLTEMGVEDVDFPEGGVIDLAGRRRPGEKILRIDMKDQRTILARPKTRLIRFDPDGAVPTYGSCKAGEVAAGDQLCLVDDDFIDMARARLNIRAAAAEEIRDYHSLVQTRFERLDGESQRDKLRTLVREMGEPPVLEDTARNWVHLDAEALKPLDLVLPRAPRDHETFLRFMTVLGIPGPIAESYWIWAVILTRKSRIRAAVQLHEAYLAILVDSFTAEHVSAARRVDIRGLRASAEAYVSVVASRSEVQA